MAANNLNSGGLVSYGPPCTPPPSAPRSAEDETVSEKIRDVNQALYDILLMQRSVLERIHGANPADASDCSAAGMPIRPLLDKVRAMACEARDNARRIFDTL